MNERWHIITGEYPPQFGGVADYTRAVAQGLAAAGDDVHVWTPLTDQPPSDDEGVAVHELRGKFGPSALARLDTALASLPGRVLLQYTPHAFGCKAMNVPLCAWLWARCRQLDVMFHEVAFPFVPGQPLRHQLLASVHRVMASLLLRVSQRIFVSVPGWTRLLRPLAARFPPPIWAPVPSNLPSDLTTTEIDVVRDRLNCSGASLVGHFGTYSPLITEQLEPALVKFLTNRADVGVLLLGQGSTECAARIVQRRPELAGRLTGPGRLEGRAAALHIACCDVMLQPFPDGVSSRRGSVMAALALGQAVVTNEGAWSESIWRESAAVELAPADQLAEAVLNLLDSPPRRELGRRASHLYRTRFAIEHTIRALRAGRESTAALAV